MKPTSDVLNQFGIAGDPILLPGGEGRTYRAGDAIIKHIHNDDPLYSEWIANLFDGITEDGFRVSKAIRTKTGAWITTDGWTAWTRLDGNHEYRNHIPESIAAIQAFHEAVRTAPKPQFLERTDDSPYSKADRYAWGAKPEYIHPDVRSDVELLYSLRRPVEGLHDQVIHGDLNPDNILLAPGLPPAIIDIAPYWRPPEFALAIYAYWIGPWRDDPKILKYFEDIPHFSQMLIRAAIRMLLIMSEFNRVHEIEKYRRATEIINDYIK